jgi:hypothetical protein
MTRTTAMVKIEGTKPILFHTFPLNTFSIDKKKEGKTGDNPEEWKDTVLMNENRQLYVYNTYLQSAISEGGKEIKAGRGNISKKITSAVEIVEPKILLDGLFVPDDESLGRSDIDPVYLDVRAVVNPMTKGRNLRYRIAAKAGWKCSFILSWEDKIVSKDQVKLSLENGGALSGIGDGRKIGFGKFKILEFVVNK